MRKTVEKIIVDILKHELNLPDNYGYTSKGDVIPTVIIYAQNVKLFNTDKLQITVRTVNTSVFSNRGEIIDTGKAFNQVQDLNVAEMLQIDVYSRNNEAKTRLPEVLMSFNSVYAQQQQDLYNFKIGIITKINNISGIDGGSDINRYSITFNVLSHSQKISEINYYNKFGVTARDENKQFLDINTYN